ncbi:unnamed protein product [Caenorhabditis auriculariae]|uniref:Receptor L-domain domain-containing protein n=1 Tax=Caenorhabditis auriculariae TaxID=2777116 RepID=A0A8S1GSC8_9PELO|nr:unnamed protein product [Caenorhabditis auriculariae]
MDKLAVTAADKIMKTAGAVGICITDARGLVLIARGTLTDSNVSSMAATVMTNARTLHGHNFDAENVPFVVLNSDGHGKFLVYNACGETIALHLVKALQRYYRDDKRECECAKCGIDKLPDGCTTIRGHVALGFEADMPPYDLVAFKLKNVTKVVGCVTITNTVYTSLEMLTNLRSIQFANRVEAISCNSM